MLLRGAASRAVDPTGCGTKPILPADGDAGVTREARVAHSYIIATRPSLNSAPCSSQLIVRIVGGENSRSASMNSEASRARGVSISGLNSSPLTWVAS